MRVLDPSAALASVRYTARPDPVRQIDVVNVSPGNTGAENRAAIAVSLAASPPANSASRARPANP